MIYVRHFEAFFSDDARCTAIMTRTEAARFLRVSVRAFDTHVRGRVTEHRIGRKPLFRKVDLETWLDQNKAGAFASTGTATSFASRTTVSASSSPRAQEILKKLRACREALRRLPRRQASSPGKG